jgi:putative FmdB family regulatory protein
MPTYSYRCVQCGPFAAVRRMAEFDLPAPCPVCAGESPRTLTVPAVLGARRGGGDSGSGVNGSDKGNEAAASGYGRLSHPAGCKCC